MSTLDEDVVMEYDGEFEDLFHEASDVEDPSPTPPADELGSLVCGEDQLFADSQLVGEGDRTPQDPASPALRSAEAEAALQETPISDWSQHVEEEERVEDLTKMPICQYITMSH